MTLNTNNQPAQVCSEDQIAASPPLMKQLEDFVQRPESKAQALSDKSNTIASVYKHCLDTMNASDDPVEAMFQLTRMFDRGCGIRIADFVSAIQSYSKSSQDALNSHRKNLQELADIARLDKNFVLLPNGSAIDLEESKRQKQLICISAPSLNSRGYGSVKAWTKRKYYLRKPCFKPNPNRKQLNELQDFNLWDNDQPWAIKPIEGDVTPLLNYIRYTWCDDDENLYNWVCMWLARIIQKPDRRPPTALVIVSRRQPIDEFPLMVLQIILSGMFKQKWPRNFGR